MRARAELARRALLLCLALAVGSLHAAPLAIALVSDAGEHQHRPGCPWKGTNGPCPHADLAPSAEPAVTSCPADAPAAAVDLHLAPVPPIRGLRAAPAGPARAALEARSESRIPAVDPRPPRGPLLV